MEALWLDHWSKMTRRYPLPRVPPPGWRAWYMPPQPTNASGGGASELWKRRGADVHFFISFNTGHCGSTVLGSTLSYYGSSTGDTNVSTATMAEGGGDGEAADAGHGGDVATGGDGCQRSSARACEGELVGLRDRAPRQPLRGHVRVLCGRYLTVWATLSPAGTRTRFRCVWASGC